MTGQDSDRLGALGELHFHQWVVERGLTANKSHHDRTGWDFIVEWPLAPAAGRPLDRRPAPIKCLVQVKSTRGLGYNRAVSLQNWEHLVRSPLPAFFLVLRFDESDMCIQAYLVHVGEREITKLLKRLREIGSSGHADGSGLSMSLRWKQVDELTGPFPGAFVERVESVVGSMGHYGPHKLAIVDTVGGGPGGSTVEVTVTVPEAYRERPADLLDDLRLGLVPELETTGAVFWDERFGIKALHPKRVERRGTLQIGSTSGREGNLWLRSGTRYVEIKARALVAVRDLEGREAKARIAAPYTDFVYRVKDRELDLSFSLPKPEKVVYLRDLSAWASIYDILTLSRQEDRPVQIGFEQFPLGSIELPKEQSPSFNDVSDVVRKAWRVASAAEVAEIARCTVPSLFDQSDTFNLLDGLMTGGLPNARMTLPKSITLPQGETLYVPSFVTVLFDQLLVLFPTFHKGVWRGKTDAERDYLVELSESRLGDPIVWRDSAGCTEQNQLDVLDALSHKAPAEHQVIRWWNLPQSGSGA